jgi:hypothetical protein
MYDTPGNTNSLGKQKTLIKGLSIFQPLLPKKLPGLREEPYLKGNHRPLIITGELPYQRGFTASLMTGDQDVDRMLVRELRHPVYINPVLIENKIIWI